MRKVHASIDSIELIVVISGGGAQGGSQSGLRGWSYIEWGHLAAWDNLQDVVPAIGPRTAPAGEKKFEIKMMSSLTTT
jgi:hypothetical protein